LKSEKLIVSARIVNEYTIKAGSNCDNILKDSGDWFSTIYNAINILQFENPHFEKVKIRTSVNILMYAYAIRPMNAFTLYEKIMGSNIIEGWDCDKESADIFIITDGKNIVKTEPVIFYNVQMDIKYPHKCFNCGKHLYFEELKRANPSISANILENLWKAKEVKFYC